MTFAPLACASFTIPECRASPRCEANLSHRNQLRLLIDGLLEVLQRDVAVGRSWDVDYPGTAQLLRVPDLSVGGNSKSLITDLVAAPFEIKRARERIDPGRC